MRLHRKAPGDDWIHHPFPPWPRATVPPVGPLQGLSSAAPKAHRSAPTRTRTRAANTRRAAGQTLGLPCPRAALAQWFWGGAGRLVISRDQVREQLRYHNNDFLGRANAHHLAVRHSGPSPSKGPARRAPRFLLEFSRRPFTGPRLARPCARDKQGQRQTRARWSGAPAASLSVSLMSHTCSESERCLFASRTCTRRTKSSYEPLLMEHRDGDRA